MTFDGLFTKWMTDEVSKEIIGGRISKIHQPLPYEIQLRFVPIVKITYYYYVLIP